MENFPIRLWCDSSVALQKHEQQLLKKQELIQFFFLVKIRVEIWLESFLSLLSNWSQKPYHT